MLSKIWNNHTLQMTKEYSCLINSYIIRYLIQAVLLVNQLWEVSDETG